MYVTKEIIVVAPEQYKALARKLAHEISRAPGCNGAVWTIKHYEENEFQLGGNRYAILMGNSEENPVTKDFLPLITNLSNQAGACFGFDGSKAVVFGEGKLEQVKDFKELIKTCTANSVRAAIAVPLVFILPLWPFLPYILGPMYFWNKGKQERKLRMEQTKAALTLFLTKHFDDWIGVKK